MAFTYGFYNALNNDRAYNAYQFSTLFDGIIVDGVFETIGQHFAVTVGTGMSVNVGTGRAWFNHTWNENDSVMPLNLPASDLNRARYDAIVLEVGDPNTDRTNAIKVVSGTPAVNPVKPTLNRGSSGNSGVDTSDETDPPWQHALAYVLVPAGAESISASNIEIVVGMDETPFVTGPLETRSIEELFNAWDAQFTAWFNNLKAQLTDNVVTNLQAQIDSNREEIEGIKEKTDQIEIKNVVHTEVITESKMWRNDTGAILNATVLLFGGGGSGSNSGAGGGGGNMTKWNGEIPVNASIPVTIGSGGLYENGSSSAGGTTSFGTYASANGGEAGSGINGGSGGTGGGASGSGYGGHGSYGGGGGAGGKTWYTYDATYIGIPGGNGGTYGGGGGGGGVTSYKSSAAVSGGNGGSAGTYGGAGGDGGGIKVSGSGTTSGENGNPGTNTIALNLEYTGTGAGGNGGGPGKNNGTTAAVTSGGGGGGGYGGHGGNGSAAIYNESQSSASSAGGGGGGGGYGADGGNACPGLVNGSNFQHGCGGGGGGYGGDGGNAVTYDPNYGGAKYGFCGQGYGAGGGGTNTANAVAGGGGGYGKVPYSESSKFGVSGRSGTCIITYIAKEVKPVN